MKHTPGPWEITGLRDQTEPHYEITSIERPFPWIAWVGPPIEDIDTAKANAHLIAAAPELMEALKRFAEYGNILRYAIWERNPYEQAMEAIAKAEGREYTPESPD